MSTDDDLLKFRGQFPILEQQNYLISNSLGAMPASVFNRLQEYAELWSSRGVKAWADQWWEMPVTAGDAIAPLIGAKGGEVSFHANITSIEQSILSCFDRSSKRKKKTRIVCEEPNFPSVIYLLRTWAESHGAELVLVPSEDGISVDLERMLEAIDERTFLVPISHVLFKSAFIQDAKSIIEKAHAVGAFVALDAYQSVGVLPIDVKDLNVDFLLGGVLKWLCGGPGGAFLYVRPDLLRTLEPGFTGWFAHRRPFEFSSGPIEYREDAFRFLHGTPSIPALYAATEGPSIIRQAGVERIREKSLRQTGIILAAAKQEGFSVRTPMDPARRGGTVSVSVPHAFEVSRVLLHEGIAVDYREGAGIRIAPHFYNTDDEVRSAMERIHGILEDQSYQRFVGSRTTVT